MSITTEQKTFIVDRIVYTINESQVSDYYDFDNLSITWVECRDSYLVETNDNKVWASPNNIVSYIQDLTDKALIEWICEDEGIEESEIAEFIAEETA